MIHFVFNLFSRFGYILFVSAFQTMELIVLTIILGGTVLLALYIGKIFKSGAATVPVHQLEQEEVEEVKEVSGGQKTKKKIVEKKQKEKAFTFQVSYNLLVLIHPSSPLLIIFSQPSTPGW